MMTGSDMQLAREETIADTARVLSRYVDAVMIRLLDHEMVQELADERDHSGDQRPDRISHPCQVMADVMTFEEKKGPIKGATVAWSGDSNNVLTSWVHAAGKLGFKMRVARPKELARARGRARMGARRQGRCRIRRRSASGGGGRGLRRLRRLGLDGRRGRAPSGTICSRAYQVNARLMARAEKGRDLHALPARPSRRGSHRRGDRRPAIRGVRRSGEPPARAEGDFDVVFGGRLISGLEVLPPWNLDCANYA